MRWQAMRMRPLRENHGEGVYAWWSVSSKNRWTAVRSAPTRRLSINGSMSQDHAEIRDANGEWRTRTPSSGYSPLESSRSPPLPAPPPSPSASNLTRIWASVIATAPGGQIAQNLRSIGWAASSTSAATTFLGVGGGGVAGYAEFSAAQKPSSRLRGPPA